MCVSEYIIRTFPPSAPAPALALPSPRRALSCPPTRPAVRYPPFPPQVTYEYSDAGFTPLMFACQQGSVEICQLLVNKDAQINVQACVCGGWGWVVGVRRGGMAVGWMWVVCGGS